MPVITARFMVSSLPAGPSRTPAVLTLIILQVGAAPHPRYPFRVVLVPQDRRSQPLCKGDLRPPPQLALGLRAVDGVAPVVPRTILDVADERGGLAEGRQEGVSQLQV